MALEEDVFSALTGLLSGRVYPEIAPQELGEGTPYAVYSVARTSAALWCAGAAVSELSLTVFIYGKTYDGVRSLKDGAVSALSGVSGFHQDVFDTPEYLEDLALFEWTIQANYLRIN